MTPWAVLLFLLLGAAAGTAHYLAIAKDADLLAHGGSIMLSLGLRLGRMLLTLGVLLVAARQGWGGLLAAAAGFMAARQVVLHRLGAVS